MDKKRKTEEEQKLGDYLTHLSDNVLSDELNQRFLRIRESLIKHAKDGHKAYKTVGTFPQNIQNRLTEEGCLVENIPTDQKCPCDPFDDCNSCVAHTIIRWK